MHTLSSKLLAGAAIAFAAAAPQAFASTVVDFESPDLTGFYLPGDSFAQGDYVLTVSIDFGTVDFAPALGAVAPSGNATQFYFNSNSGNLSLARQDGTGFSLDGFSAAFVPLDPPSSETTVLFAKGTTLSGTEVSAFWNFPSSSSSSFPFVTYTSALEPFTNLAKVDFYACTVMQSAICAMPTQNNGQFAIDNILVTAVPEPGVALLLSAGLFGLALRARRRSR